MCNLWVNWLLLAELGIISSHKDKAACYFVSYLPFPDWAFTDVQVFLQGLT